MNRLSTTLTSIVLVLTALPETAWACEHCFGASVDTMTTRGIAVAMAALLGFTGLVGSGVMNFFRKMAQRARALEAGDLVVTEFGELVEKRADDEQSY